MHELKKTRVFPLLAGIVLVSIAACQKLPQPEPVVPVPASEKKAHNRILSLAGEVGERDAKGHITIVFLEGDKIDNKVLSELVELKKLEILELRNTAVTKRGISKLKKILTELEVIETTGAFKKKVGDKKGKK